MSPHGHCDPVWWAEDAAFPDPAALLITPDHDLFRMLYALGVAMEDLGMGKFHRTHQARYTHVANGFADRPWRITGVAMHKPDLRDATARAGWKYDLGIMGPVGLRIERIGVHDRVLVAAEDPRPFVDAIADPDVSASTLTVTE